MKNKKIVLEGIDDQVDKILSDKQKNKDFKDAGQRAKGSRKEMAAFDKLLTAADIETINQDEALARNLIKKSRILPAFDAQAQRAKGFSSGDVYLQRELYNKLPAEPKEFAKHKYGKSFRVTPEMERKAYVLAITAMYGCILKFKLADGEWRGADISKYLLELFVDRKLEMDIKSSLAAYHGRYIAEMVLGASFINLFAKSTEAASVQWFNAHGYSGISKELADQKRNKAISIREKAAEEYRKGDKAAKEHYAIQDKGYRNAVSFEKFCESMIKRYTAQINSEQFKKYPYVETPESWAWLEVGKEQNSDEKKDEAPLFTPIAVKPKASSERTPLEYIVRKGGMMVSDVSEQKIIDYFGFKSVVFGNWMKDNESREHVRHFIGAMVDMFEVLNFNAKPTVQQAGLSIAFGAYGKGRASATYLPDYKVINLTKTKGDGCVAHEFWHYLDNCLSLSGFKYITERNFDPVETSKSMAVSILQDEVRKLVRFLSDGEGNYKEDKIPYGTTIPRETKKESLIYSKQYIAPSLEETIKNLSEISNYLNVGYRNFSYKTVFRIADELATHFELEYTPALHLFKKVSKPHFVAYSEQDPKYLGSIVELTARAWESYVLLKFEMAGRANNYLCQSPNDNMTFFYPSAKDMTYLEPIYDGIVRAMRNIWGAFDGKLFESAERVNEYIAFNEKAKTEKVAAGVVAVTETKESDLAKAKRIRIAKAKAQAIKLKLQLAA